MFKQLLPLFLWSVLSAGVVDASSLWLPASYREWLPKLNEEVTTLTAKGECQQVISASLSEKQSTIEHPVFRIVCRDSTNTSYAVLIDAITHEQHYVNPGRAAEHGAPQSVEEQQKELAAAAVKLEAKRVDCEQELQQRTTFMQNFSWVSARFSAPRQVAAIEIDPMSKNTAQVVVLEGNFNTSDSLGRPLKFRALCTIQDEKNQVFVKISPRVITDP